MLCQVAHDKVVVTIQPSRAAVSDAPALSNLFASVRGMYSDYFASDEGLILVLPLASLLTMLLFNHPLGNAHLHADPARWPILFKATPA